MIQGAGEGERAGGLIHSGIQDVNNPKQGNKMRVSPKVSVCIPTYNYADYLPMAIESVLGQNFRDFELIIQDDCSNDATVETVQRYLTDERVVFEVNEKNLGLAGNWNRCLAKARGEYIKFVFADDLLASPDALGRMVSALDSAQEVSLVASARNIINADSHLVRVLCEFKKSFTAEGAAVIHMCLVRQANLVGEPTVVMFRRKDAERGFNAEYDQMIDLEMWFYLLEKGEFAFIAEPLASFRIHPRQKTAENARNLLHFDEFFRLLEEYLSRPYIKLAGPIKYYLKIDMVYQFWKSRKKGLVDRKTAIERIGARFPVTEFFLVLPVYKTIKPLVKLFKKVSRKIAPL